MTNADRRALLLGTALVSTLLLGTLTTPTTANAQATCPPSTFPPPGPITIINPAAGSIDCDNIFDRYNAGNPVIDLQTNAAGEFISLDNSGNLTSPDNRGIRAYSLGGDSPVTVINTGNIDSYFTGIYARTRGGAVNVFNHGHITSVFDGIQASGGITGVADSPVSIINTGDIDLQEEGTAISATTYGDNSRVYVFNSGALSGGRHGIFGRTDAVDSRVDIVNSGDIWAISTQPDPAIGIAGFTSYDDSPVSITNSGNIWAIASASGRGIEARTLGSNSSISIVNTGRIWVKAGGVPYNAIGISGLTGGPGSAINIVSSGDIWTSSQSTAFGIFGQSGDADSPVNIKSSSNIRSYSTFFTAGGVGAQSVSSGSALSIENSGDLTIAGRRASGLYAIAYGANSPALVVNSGNVRATAELGAYGIRTRSTQANSPVTINNSGSVFAEGDPNAIVAGISVRNLNSSTTIINSGDIGASSQLAIQVLSGPVDIFNTGTITGFVRLDAADRFINQAGGVFEARQTSDFDRYGTGGTDLFRNQAGATVHTNGKTRFVNLERFENAGLISMVDGRAGDGS